MGFIFPLGNFREEGHIMKTRKLPPHKNFHVYSI